ncbi:MAG TPA: hypothetical protein VMG13_03130 [Trebonia sp.]|nr:hypothetical protein [Trebonia sp.]
MIVSLWDAGSTHGVSDDESRAILAAEGAMRAVGPATVTAVVERAFLVPGIESLTSNYLRAGDGWSGTCQEGLITWGTVPGPGSGRSWRTRGLKADGDE